MRFFAVRVEPFYHKAAYSKTPKADVAAALLGVTVGAIGAYAALGAFGSGAIDLTDLTVLVYYASAIAYLASRAVVVLSRRSGDTPWPLAGVFVLVARVSGAVSLELLALVWSRSAVRWPSPAGNRCPKGSSNPADPCRRRLCRLRRKLAVSLTFL